MASTTAPVPSIHAEGEFYRRLSRRPTLVAVVGAWLIFLPAIVVLPLFATLKDGTHPAALLLIAAMLLVCLVVPITVTKRYLQQSRK